MRLPSIAVAPAGRRGDGGGARRAPTAATTPARWARRRPGARGVHRQGRRSHRRRVQPGRPREDRRDDHPGRQPAVVQRQLVHARVDAGLGQRAGAATPPTRVVRRGEQRPALAGRRAADRCSRRTWACATGASRWRVRAPGDPRIFPSGRRSRPDGGQRYQMLSREAIILNYTAAAAWKLRDVFGVGATVQWIHVPRLVYSLMIDGAAMPPNVATRCRARWTSARRPAGRIRSPSTRSSARGCGRCLRSRSPWRGRWCPTDIVTNSTLSVRRS